jgi:SAM-dependent methyltransferase
MQSTVPAMPTGSRRPEGGPGRQALSSADERALASGGTSTSPVYRLVQRILQGRGIRSGLLLDVGCGTGSLAPYVRDFVHEYAGADLIRYPDFPPAFAFYPVNLDIQTVQLADGAADVVVCAETIEHVENPRALVRELTRLTKPGGLLVITTPNNLSLMSKLCLVLKNQFVMFQDASYPAHITALLQSDLARMARECGLEDVRFAFSNRGRVPGTGWHWPGWLRGRAFSDNVAVSALKPKGAVGGPNVRE